MHTCSPPQLAKIDPSGVPRLGSFLIDQPPIRSRLGSSPSTDRTTPTKIDTRIKRPSTASGEPPKSWLISSGNCWLREPRGIVSGEIPGSSITTETNPREPNLAGLALDVIGIVFFRDWFFTDGVSAIILSAGYVMRILLFIVIWIGFFLGVPLILHLLFSSREYPLVSIGVVISFVGGALLSAWITGLFRRDQSSQSK